MRVRNLAKLRNLWTSSAAVALLVLVVSGPAATIPEDVETALPKDVSVLAPPGAYNYSDYSAIRSTLMDIVGQHSDIARLYDIGDSWEKTQGIADRDILALKLSDNAGAEEEEPEVLIMGLHHAREWPTSEIVMAVAETVVASYGVDPRISWLVDNRQIWLIPVVNPDGLDYALSVDELWRKNRRLNYDLSYGVDLNRNYNGSENGDPAGAWGGAGTSDDPSNDVYCGEAPFSEPETQAIRGLTVAHDFQIAIDFHTHGDLVMWPWSYTWETTVDDEHLVRIGNELAVLNGYVAEQGIALYPTTGDSTDWLYGKGRTFAYCIEVGDEGGSTADQFHPSGYDTVMGLIGENVPVVLEVIEISGDREERGFQILHDLLPSQQWSEDGFPVETNVTADRGVNSSSVEVVYSVNGGAWLSSPLSKSAENDTYVGRIPPIPTSSVVEYYISAEDTGGILKMSPAYAPYAVYSFDVSGGPSDDPPMISHTPRTESYVGDTEFVEGVGLTIWAAVTDDYPVVDVYLYYRSAGSEGPFYEVAMEEDQHAPGSYQGTLSSGFEGGLEYYISAVDSGGNTNTSPEGAPVSFHEWYNLPASLVAPELPGSPSGVVGISASTQVGIRVSDDYSVSSVILRVEAAGLSGYDADMELLSGSSSDGLWVAGLSTLDAPGIMWLNFSAWDGIKISHLNGTVLQVVDLVPPVLEYLEVEEISADDPSITVTVSDDIGVEKVSCWYSLGLVGGDFSELEMTLQGGDEVDGIYVCVLDLGGFVGYVRFYFVANDSYSSAKLPGGAPASAFAALVFDPSPIQLTCNLPDVADGSEPIVVNAEVSNWTEGLRLRLRLVNTVSGDLHIYLLGEGGGSTFTCTILAGTLLGTYLSIFEALSEDMVVWSSENRTMNVQDMSPPELKSVDADYHPDTGLLEIQVMVADEYGVEIVTILYRSEGEIGFSTAYSVLLATAGESSTWNCSFLIDPDAVLEYYVVVSDGSNSPAFPEPPALYTFDPTDEGLDGGAGGLLESLADNWLLFAVAAVLAVIAGFLTWRRLSREEQS